MLGEKDLGARFVQRVIAADRESDVNFTSRAFRYLKTCHVDWIEYSEPDVYSNHAFERVAERRAPHGVDGPRFARPITPGERPT